MSSVVFASDTHLSHRTPEALTNWDAVVQHVDDTRPALVVHVGDLTLDGLRDPDELTAARELLDRLPVPWLAVPGNHDIGDNPWPGSPDGITVNADRLERWRATMGADWWSAELDGWTLVAIDAQLLESDLDAEAEQWAWLDETFAAIADARPVVLISHKPLAADEAELAASPAYRFVPAEARQRLDRLLAAAVVPLVVSGHVHQYRELGLDGRRHVWAPTTWAVLPDSIQPWLGTKACGVLTLELGAGNRADTSLMEPPGITQLTLTRDIPDPYVSHP